VARLRAVLRRATPSGGVPSSGVTHAGDAVIRRRERIAEWRGWPLDLTSTEYNVLEVPVCNAGRVVSKAELSEQALGRPLERYDRSLDMHVASLRRKLGTLPDGRSPIQTVRGMGYQFIAG
jgi:DNA-binding response OmpR family regulator